MAKDDCLTAPSGLGLQKITIKLKFKNDKDLARKFHAMGDSMSGNKKLFFNSPRWLRAYRKNCCGSSGP